MCISAMKNDQNSLVQLIHALSPAEKQRFKRKHDPASDFIRAFDYINRTGNSSASAVQKWLLKKGREQRNVTPGYVSVIKRYLQDKILESLRIQQSHAQRYELLNRCINTDILLEKGLYDHAKQEIAIARSKYFESSFPIDKLMLLRRSSILQYYQNYAETKREDLDTLYHERLAMAEQLLLQVKYARVLSLLSFQYFRGKADDHELESYMNEAHMADPDLAKDFETRYLFHWVHAQFAEMQRDPVTAIKHFEKAVVEWTSNPDYINAHPRMYLGTCFTYLKYRLQQPNPYEQILDQVDLENLLTRLSVTNFNQDVIDNYADLFTIGQLLGLRKEGKFDAIITMATSLLQKLKTSRQPAGFNRILTQFILAAAYFYTEDYKQADLLLSELIQTREIEVRNNPEYFSLVLILSMCGQYELGNLKYLKNLRTRYKHLLVKHHLYNDLELIFMKMFAQLTSEQYRSAPSAVFSRFLPRVTKALRIVRLDAHLDYALIINWIKRHSEAD